MLDLSGKVALVTGAARGIGEGIASVLARAGARVALNDLDHTVSRTAERIPGAIGITGNVSEVDDAAHIVESVLDSFGRFDILVNNAGISGPRGGLKRTGLSDWQHVFDVNLRGTFLMSRAAAPLMAGQNAGRIINIASITGLVGFPGSHAYGVSKAAVVMLTQTMSIELARSGVTVNAIAPGIIQAPMLDAVSEQGRRDADLKARIPLGHFGLPEDIGRAVAFLASPLARYITGVTLPVDGGWVAFGGHGAAHVTPTPLQQEAQP